MEFPSCICLVSFSWSSFPGLIFLVLSPVRFQISDCKFQVSGVIFHTLDFGFQIKLSDFIIQLFEILVVRYAVGLDIETFAL